MLIEVIYEYMPLACHSLLVRDSKLHYSAMVWVRSGITLDYCERLLTSDSANFLMKTQHDQGDSVR
jgi:hypothetical protein